MIQFAGVLSLAAEALAEINVTRHFGAQHLDSNRAPQNRVFGVINLRHAAGSDDLAKVVAVIDHVLGTILG